MTESTSDAELVLLLALDRPSHFVPRRQNAAQNKGSSHASESGDVLDHALWDREEALRELLRRHGPSVMALARRMLGNREEAEEVVQDAFLRLYRNAEGFRPGTASVRTYLYAIARNLATSRLRARSARPKSIPGIDPHDVAFQAAVGVPDDPLPGILVRDALSTLETDERELLDGAFYLGFSHAELALKHGLPLGTVKSRVRRALLKLRTLLGENGS